MATGGVFTIITNDGKQDRMLMATSLLKERLNKIMKLRAQRGLDPTPTLTDIEKTHILFMNSHFKPFAALGYEYNKVKPTGSVMLGSDVEFNIPQFGDFFNDMAFHIILSDPVPTGGTNPTYRWCQYPGERLCKKVSFTVNGNPLDEYYSHDYTFFRQFELDEMKVPAYNRCMGQENPQHAEFYQASTAPTNSRICGLHKNGFQTPRTTAHGQVEMFIPLLFWFNKDPRLSIPSVSIPFGQRFITLTLASQAELVGIESRGNASGGTIGTSNVTLCELYVNNIFVNPEVHDIYIKRIGFNLIRVHRRQTHRISTASGSLLLNSFKWPIEHFYIGFRPSGNGLTSNQNHTGSGNALNHLDHWHYFSRVTRNDVTGNPITAFVDTQVHPIASMSVTAHGITIYDNFPSAFYNSYIPFVYGEKIRGPTDIGAYMVTFNLFPGAYQPSGHINVSRAREFYVNYDSTTLATPISTSAPVDMIGSASAINFLLVSDGSAVIRYST